MSAWTQEQLATYRAIGDWESLWEATVPLVKLQYGRMVRAGAVPEPAFKGDDEWLQEMMLLAGEAMRKWDPEKGAYSTYILATVSRNVGVSMDRESRRGVVARHGIQAVAVLSVEDQRPGAQPDDEAEDDGTFSAVLSYGGVVDRVRRPDEAPEGLGDPADEAERAEAGARLVAALACLPPTEREALVATQVETQEEYARRTGVPLRTVEWRVAQARRRVAAFLESGTN